MKRVFFVVLPQVHILDLGGPMQILATLPELGLAQLEIHCVGPSPELASFQGPQLSAVQPLPQQLASGDVVIVVGSKIQPGAPLSQHAQALPDGVAIASVCTGAFLLAAAGLLDGRFCTTHHDYLKRLQQCAPKAKVVQNRLLVQDGPIYTSAGVSAGIDLALHLITQHFDAATGLQVARENVVQFRRFGNDPALDVQLCYRNHNHPQIHAVQDFLSQHPADSLHYADLAKRFALSYRHLARLFQQECGITLKQYHQQLRLHLARQLLKERDWSIERVAEHCGFGSTQAFRAAWSKEEPTPPKRWRAA